MKLTDKRYSLRRNECAIDTAIMSMVTEKSRLHVGLTMI